MSQQLLYHTQVGTVIQKMRRKGMPKHMRMHMHGKRAGISGQLHAVLYAARGQPLPPLIDEHDIVFLLHPLWTHLLKIVLQQLSCQRIKGNNALLVSLTVYGEDAIVQIDIV